MMHGTSWAVALSMVCFAAGSAAQECCRSPEESTASAIAAAIPASVQERPFLGVYLGEEGNGGEGIAITGVVPGGAAERSGFQAGDRLLSIDGEEVSDVSGLVELLGTHAVGDRIRVVFLRDGERMNTSVRLGAAPSEGQEVEEVQEVEEPEEPDAPEPVIREGERGWLGVEISEGDGGIEILTVRPGSPAERAGLQPHDVLKRLADQSVEDMNGLLEVLTDLGPGTRASVTFERQGETHKTKVTLGSLADAESGGAETQRRMEEEQRARAEEVRERARERGAEIADQVRRAREETRSGAPADQMDELRSHMDELRAEMDSLRHENEQLRHENEKLRRALNEVEKLLQRLDDRTSAVEHDGAGAPEPAGILHEGHGNVVTWVGTGGAGSGGGGKAHALRVLPSGEGDAQVIRLHSDDEDGDADENVFHVRVANDEGEGKNLEFRLFDDGTWKTFELPADLEKLEALPGVRVLRAHGGEHQIQWHSEDGDSHGTLRVRVRGDADGECEDCQDCAACEGCSGEGSGQPQVFVVPGAGGVVPPGLPAAPAALPRVKLAAPITLPPFDVPAITVPRVKMAPIQLPAIRVPKLEVKVPKIRVAAPVPGASCCPCVPAPAAAPAPAGCCAPAPAAAPMRVAAPAECRLEVAPYDLEVGPCVLELEAPECVLEVQCDDAPSTPTSHIH